MTAIREGFFQRHARKILASERYALVAALILAAMPFMGWLAEALVALVTLRQGAKAGAKLLIPVMLVHTLVSIWSIPVSMALMLAMLNVLPCYIAAHVLRTTTSWRAVASVLLSLVVLGAMVLQMLFPAFINDQYMHLEAMLKSLASNQANFLDFWLRHGVSPLVLANYLLGVQAVSLVFSAMVPLFVARTLQAQLYYPGGFREELFNFRGDKISLIVLGLLMLAAYFEQYLAINSLPLVLFYFVLAGLSLGAYMFSNMRPLAAMAILVLPIIFLSWVMLPLYALIGALDSVFDFRSYLSSKVKEV